MKKILLGLGAAACVFGFGSSAFATGTGGIAGSAAFQLTGGIMVDSASVAIGVGKSSAYAGATTTDLAATGPTTEAFAAGAGGAITLTGAFYIASIAEDTALATPKDNIMAVGAAVVSIDATAATVTVP